MDVTDHLPTFSLEALSKQIKVPHIDRKVHFWMIRTKNGAFYHEFIQEGYIAIGWNILKGADLREAAAPTSLKALLRENYPGETNLGGALNKCIRFVREFQEGDLVMIVGKNEVAFAEVGSYYEVDGQATSVQQELAVNTLITEEKLPSTPQRELMLSVLDKKDLAAHNEEHPCPYAKRRKIRFLTTKSFSGLNPLLLRGVFQNRHSLSSMDSYAELILGSAYDVYTYRNRLNMIFHITSREALGSLDVSKFIYYATQILHQGEPLFIGTRINLNSPGDLALFIENGIGFIEEHWPFFLALAVALFGGDIKTPTTTISLPSLKNAIQAYCKRERTRQLEELELQEQQERVRGMQLDNERKAIELERAMKEISEAAVSLKIRPLDSKVIPFEYLNKPKQDE